VAFNNAGKLYALGGVKEYQALAAGTVAGLSWDAVAGRMKFCLLDLTCVAEIAVGGKIYIPGQVKENEVFANRRFSSSIIAEAAAVVVNIGAVSVIELTVKAMRLKGKLFENTLGGVILP